MFCGTLVLSVWALLISSVLGLFCSLRRAYKPVLVRSLIWILVFSGQHGGGRFFVVGLPKSFSPFCGAKGPLSSVLSLDR